MWGRAEEGWGWGRGRGVKNGRTKIKKPRREPAAG